MLFFVYFHFFPSAFLGFFGQSLENRGKEVEPMRSGANTLLFILLTILWSGSVAIVSSILRLNYKRVTFVIVFGVVCLGFLYQYLYFLKINEISAREETHKIKEAFFRYSLKEDRSVNAEHRLLFEPNKNYREKKYGTKNALSYIFYEKGKITSFEATLNGHAMKLSDLNLPNTYEWKTDAEKNILTFYFSYDKVQPLDVIVKYSVQNALREHEGLLVYYNTFFSERTDFSFNTNVKGDFSFQYPEGSLLRCGADAENFWVRADNAKNNSREVRFKNKIPYMKRFFSIFADWNKLYDPVRGDKSYMKDFSFTVRLDFLPASFQGEVSPFAKEWNDNTCSVSELTARNEEHNRKFSDVKFLVGVFISSWTRGICLFLVFSLPIAYSYYERAKEKACQENVRKIFRSDKD